MLNKLIVFLAVFAVLAFNTLSPLSLVADDGIDLIFRDSVQDETIVSEPKEEEISAPDELTANIFDDGLINWTSNE